MKLNMICIRKCMQIFLTKQPKILTFETLYGFLKNVCFPTVTTTTITAATTTVVVVVVVVVVVCST